MGTPTAQGLVILQTPGLDDKQLKRCQRLAGPFAKYGRQNADGMWVIAFFLVIATFFACVALLVSVEILTVGLSGRLKSAPDEQQRPGAPQEVEMSWPAAQDQAPAPTKRDLAAWRRARMAWWHHVLAVSGVVVSVAVIVMAALAINAVAFCVGSGVGSVAFVLWALYGLMLGFALFGFVWCVVGVVGNGRVRG